MTAADRSHAAVLPRLLAGIDPSGRPVELAEHVRQNGPLPALAPAALIEEVARSGLRGRGGADFPTARKLQAVAQRRGASAVIVNGSETEPSSHKDAVLMAALPHLVLDGALLAAATVGAGEVILTLREGAQAALRALEHAVQERRERIPISVVAHPEGYVTGEETAVLSHLAGGRAVPRFTPPRPYERGYRGRPTLVQNAETLAQLALVARFGADWFRALGTEEDPGTVLATVSGAVPAPGVYEMAFGTPLWDLIDAAGGSTEPIQAFLVGGYFGSWVSAERAHPLRLARSELLHAGLSLGSGVVIALGASACGLHESARLARYLAGQSAGQCGPCLHGLAAIAQSLTAIVDGTARRGERERLLRWCEEVRGRGACHHPDGAVRMIRSAIETFGDQIETHVRGACRAQPAALPTVRRESVAQ
jgi:NADH:ubiquinone oxidoreductase subunit F (NADH-binding)